MQTEDDTCRFWSLVDWLGIGTDQVVVSVCAQSQGFTFNPVTIAALGQRTDVIENSIAIVNHAVATNPWVNRVCTTGCKIILIGFHKSVIITGGIHHSILTHHVGHEENILIGIVSIPTVCHPVVGTSQHLLCPLDIGKYRCIRIFIGGTHFQKAFLTTIERHGQGEGDNINDFFHILLVV